MSIKITDDDGKEMEVYTPEELAAEKTARETAEKTVGELQTKLTSQERVLAEKNENFKRFKDLTEEDKAKMTADQIETSRALDNERTAREALEAEIKTDKATKITKATDRAVAAYSGGNEDLKKQLEENITLVALEVTDEDSAMKKVELAYNMLGIGKPKINPLHQTWNGTPPGTQPEKFTETERGKAAASEMGDITFNN